MVWQHDSKICVCGHYKGDHYKKNYVIDSGHGYGNVDFLGCDGSKDCTCMNFHPMHISKELYGFENAFTWEMDKELKDIHMNEIAKDYKGWFGMWFRKNQERYIAMVDKRMNHDYTQIREELMRHESFISLDLGGDEIEKNIGIDPTDFLRCLYDLVKMGKFEKAGIMYKDIELWGFRRVDAKDE